MPDQDKPNQLRRPRPSSAKGTPTPTSASAWKKKSVGGTPCAVPSGNICLVRTPGLQVFLRDGAVPNALMPMIQASLATGKAPTEKDLESLTQSETAFEDMLNMVDNIVLKCVIDPKVEPTPMRDDGKGGLEPIPFGDPGRDDDILYVDEVDLDDKFFIFNFVVGGTSAIEPFRKEQGANVDNVPAVQDVELPTESII